MKTYFKTSLQSSDHDGGIMKQLVIFLVMLTLAGPSAVFAATLQNTDSEEYELQIQEPGRPGSQYRIGGQAKVEIAFMGAR
jgi:hypothetical protein